MGNVALGFCSGPLVFPDIQKSRELSANGKAGEGAPYIKTARAGHAQAAIADFILCLTLSWG